MLPLLHSLYIWADCTQMTDIIHNTGVQFHTKSCVNLLCPCTPCCCRNMLPEYWVVIVCQIEDVQRWSEWEHYCRYSWNNIRWYLLKYKEHFIFTEIACASFYSWALLVMISCTCTDNLCLIFVSFSCSGKCYLTKPQELFIYTDLLHVSSKLRVLHDLTLYLPVFM